MKQPEFPDIHEIMDKIFSAAEDIREAVAQEIGMGDHKGPWMSWFEQRDYYPGYSYPPLNVFMTNDRSMVLQIALAGFSERDVSLEYRGDHLVFRAAAPKGFEAEDGVRYFKRRLKLKDIEEQRYYVPADKFDQDATKAVFRDAILTITIPPREAAPGAAARTVNITREGAKKEKE